MGSSTIKNTRRIVSTGNELGALTSGYVPYTGAVSNVDLGANSLTAVNVTIKSMTQGSVLFSGPAGIVAQNNANFFWDNTNKFLGVGNNTPAYAIDVRTAVASSEVTISNQNTDSTGGSSLQVFNENSTRYGRIFQTNSTSTYGTIYSTNSSFFEGYGTTVGFGNGQSNGTMQQYAGGVATTNVYYTLTPAATSGAVTNFLFQARVSTGQTAGTNIPNFKITGASKTWASGTVTNQYWNYLSANTVAFVSASTMTNSFALYVESATTGVNATITNNFSIGTNGTITSGGQYFWLNKAGSESTSNYAVSVDGSGNTNINSTNTLGLSISGSSKISVLSYQISTNLGTASGGNLSAYSFNSPSYTAQTASTEANYINWATAAIQFATGTLTLQRHFLIGTPTYSFVGASTLTTAATFSVGYPQGGTNATITQGNAIYVPTVSLTNTTTGIGLNIEGPTGATNKYAAKFLQGTGTLLIGEYTSGRSTIWLNQTDSGASSTNWALSANSTTTTFLNGSSTINLLIAGSINVAFTSLIAAWGGGQASYDFQFTSTNGTKLGTATSQKIAFWNATPIVQPTTAIAASTFAANTSLIANDTATFDGYTIGQVVKALRNTGLLA